MQATDSETFILPAVAAAIFNKQGEVLLQQRTDVGKWGVISGHVEFGETVEQAVLREIMEETNSKASLIRLIGVYSSPSSQTYYYANKTVQYITTYFEASLPEDVDLTFANNETAALRFFKPAALPAALAQMHPYWLSDALNKHSMPVIR
jgi:8-oxo-dGTP diphosphatase